MERAAAISKLGKILGKKLGYRVDPKAPTREEREAARTELPTAIAERKVLAEKKEARCKVLLEADAEYQALTAAYDKAREHTNKLSAITRHYKITVGVSDSMFFLIKAEGDSWEEVVDKLTAKKQVA